MSQCVPEALFVIPGDDEDDINDKDDTADIGYPPQDVPDKGLAHVYLLILLIDHFELHHFFTYCGTTGASLHDNKI